MHLVRLKAEPLPNVRVKMGQPDEEEKRFFWEMTLDIKGQYLRPEPRKFSPGRIEKKNHFRGSLAVDTAALPVSSKSDRMR